MKGIDLGAEPIVDQDVIDFIKEIYEYKINDELPFHTCDYYYMERLIEYLEAKKNAN